MHKKTSVTTGLAIATILTAYISVPTFSNQAFAQHLITPTTLMYGKLGQTLAGQAQSSHGEGLGDCPPPCQANVKVLGQELAQGIKAQVGKVLVGLESHPGKH